MTQRVSRAPPHRTHPAFLNRKGTFNRNQIFKDPDKDAIQATRSLIEWEKCFTLVFPHILGRVGHNLSHF